MHFFIVFVENILQIVNFKVLIFWQKETSLSKY